MASYKPLLPPSLQAYAEGKSPAAIFSQSGHTRQPQSQTPPRSRLLSAMMAPRQGPSLADTAIQSGSGLWKGYNQTQQKEGLVEDPKAYEERKKTGLATIGEALTGAAGAIIPGWGGKIAQLAGMMMGQYGKDRLNDSRSAQMRSLLSENDPEKRNRAMMYMLATENR